MKIPIFVLIVVTSMILVPSTYEKNSVRSVPVQLSVSRGNVKKYDVMSVSSKWMGPTCVPRVQVYKL